MSEILVIQSWPRRSGVPADTIDLQWVFHYGVGAPDDTAFDAIAALLDAFWTDAPGGGAGIPQDKMSTCLSNNADAVELLMFDITAHLDGSPHGSPVGLRTLSLVPGDDTALPAECCSVLTYHRPYALDVEFGAGGLRPRARDRGRLYMGPLGGGAVEAPGVNNETYLKDAVIASFVGAAENLAADHTTVAWAQWSRANADVGLVSDWWMDNAVDIQRRRGNAATTRTTGSV